MAASAVSLAATDTGPLDDWRRSAACKGLKVGIFYQSAENPMTEMALDVCRSCPVAPECLADGLQHEGSSGYRYGVFGATTPEMRRQMAGGRSRRVKIGELD